MRKDLLKKICKNRAFVVEEARVRVDGLVAGEKPALQKGLGLEVEDFREYVYGDDFRHIDWKVTARAPYTDYPRFYVREYRGEKALNMLVLLDCSASMSYGSKWPTALGVLAFLIEMARKFKDRVGVYTLGLSEPLYIRPQDPRGLAEYFFSKVCSEGLTPTGTVQLLDSVGSVLPYVTRHHVVALVTDAAHCVDKFAHAVRLLRERSMSIYAVLVVDPNELEVPPLGLALLEDYETNVAVGLTSSDDADLLASYLKRHLETIEYTLRSAGVPSVRVSAYKEIAFKLRKLLILYSRAREAAYV